MQFKINKIFKIGKSITAKTYVGVVSKHSWETLVQTVRQIIDIDQKQERPNNRTLGDLNHAINLFRFRRICEHKRETDQER